MSTTAQAQVAYNESLKLDAQELVSQLVRMIGQTLTAYIAGVNDAHEIDSWQANGIPSPEVEAKLRFVYRVSKHISQHYSSAVAQAWLQGVNPELDDRVALQLIRDEPLFEIEPDIMAAQNVFLEA